MSFFSSLHLVKELQQYQKYLGDMFSKMKIQPVVSQEQSVHVRDSDMQRKSSLALYWDELTFLPLWPKKSLMYKAFLQGL